MNLGLATERTAETAEFDPMEEFKKGVELLKNGYPVWSKNSNELK
jgi:hypothetical protein